MSTDYQMDCPRCGAMALAAHEDLGGGLGVQQIGPYQCGACGWSDEDELRSMQNEAEISLRRMDGND